MTDPTPHDPRQKIVLLTGPSGAGRITAIRALEDIGFEAIDNMPLSLLPRLLDGPPHGRPMALGIDVRTRDFSVSGMMETLTMLNGREDVDADLVFLDCRADVLSRRFSETRRRHPMATAESPSEGIAREKELLVPIRAEADILIDTSDFTLHDLRAEMSRWFSASDGGALALSIQSFSYKRGVPRGIDMVFDCRFLKNPYWEPSLRGKNGSDAAVAEYIAQDDRFAPFYENILNLTELLLPAYIEEGKSHLSIGFGCTGGQHRSVAVTEKLANSLEEQGWRVSKRHLELERRAPSTG